MTLIEKCKELKKTLEMALEGALEIQAETKTENLDVVNIRHAIHAVTLRIAYLEKRAADEKAAKAQAEKDAKEKAEADAKAKAEGNTQQ